MREEERCEVREKHCQKFARKKFIGTGKVYAVHLAMGERKVCVLRKQLHQYSYCQTASPSNAS